MTRGQQIWRAATAAPIGGEHPRHPIIDGELAQRIILAIDEALATQQHLNLRRDEPVNNPEDYMHWRCDIWETGSVPWPLFATAWGDTATEARSKANSIIAACGRAEETSR